jgi:hypothetical protein
LHRTAFGAVQVSGVSKPTGIEKVYIYGFDTLSAIASSYSTIVKNRNAQ